MPDSRKFEVEVILLVACHYMQDGCPDPSGLIGSRHRSREEITNRGFHCGRSRSLIM